MKIRFGSCPAMCLVAACLSSSLVTLPAAQDSLAPIPLLKSGQPVDWWFVFKCNAESFPECGRFQRTCSFGGTVEPYKSFGQQFAFASSADGTLQQGFGCVGDTAADPLGATFDRCTTANSFTCFGTISFTEIRSRPSPRPRAILRACWHGTTTETEWCCRSRRHPGPPPEVRMRLAKPTETRWGRSEERRVGKEG